MKKNNKGFSLVELIVVVAIMAVLMTVLAPQLLRYVEQSRLQKDNSAIAEIANAMKIAAADEDINTAVANAGTTGLTIKFASASGDDATGAKVVTYGAGVLDTEVKAIVPSFTTASNTYTKSTKNITLTIKIDGSGNVVVEAGGMITTPNATTPDATQPKF